ncbi:hypothetical protein DL93DRAFT_2171213 [Clavulina sp. PMI_390]|nr:hypothetical protein DL93DRAFT_2171213 [Clavulina sp. PMI_390]
MMRLPAELIDLIVFQLANEDVDSFSRVNSTFNAFANRRSWRVYKLAFPFQLSSLKAACLPIVSNPIRALSIRVLILGPGFSLSKQSLSNGGSPSNMLLPTFETSRASLESITKPLVEAFQLLPNIRELVVPEVRHHYPDRRFTSHQIQWLNRVYEIVGNSCKASSLHLVGLYSSTPQAYMVPILESAYSSLERITLLNEDQDPFKGGLAAFNKVGEPLCWKMPHLTHLLYPHSSQPLTSLLGVRNNGLTLISRPLSKHRELWPPKFVLIFFKEGSSAQPVVEYQTEDYIGDPTCIAGLKSVLQIISRPFWYRQVAFQHPSSDHVVTLPAIFHLKYYFERASALLGRDDDDDIISVTRAQFIEQLAQNICDMLGRDNNNSQLQHTVISFWFSDTTASVAKMKPCLEFCVHGVVDNVVRYRTVLLRNSSPLATSSSTSASAGSWKWCGETEIQECPPRWGLDAATWDRLCGFGNVPPPTIVHPLLTSTLEHVDGQRLLQ